MTTRTALRLETRRPFTRADAIEAGITPKQLRGSRFRRLFRGVYVEARVPDHPLIRAQGALVLHPPDARASHLTAAAMKGLPVPKTLDVHVTVTRKADRSRAEGIVCHVAGRKDGDVVEVAGVRVSADCLMFVELAAVLGLVDHVVVGDALVRMKAVTREELAAFSAVSTDRYAAKARRAASYVRAGVDSPMETRLRMLLVLAGLPEPTINLSIRDEYGRERFRLDLSYPELKLAVEYDGRQHADDTAQWGHDLERREWLDDEQWKVLVVTSKGIYQHPGDTVERVRRNLRARGCREVPKRLPDEWRRHFPGR